MMANTVTAIVALLQMGVLEIHPWGSTSRDLDRPDRLIFDFDPDEDLAWERLVEATGLLRTVLDKLGLEGFLKTTGGKGLHVVVPIRPDHGWDVARAFSKAVVDLLVQASPERFTTKLAKHGRGGKILLDYLRNAQGATAVAAYSLRARANAPVSMPIQWDELDADGRSDTFNVRTALTRLGAQTRDPWAGFAQAAKQSITRKMLATIGLG
jgi:bifunctional non-homologous end joining protein LigD